MVMNCIRSAQISECLDCLSRLVAPCNLWSQLKSIIMPTLMKSTRKKTKHADREASNEASDRSDLLQHLIAPLHLYSALLCTLLSKQIKSNITFLHISYHWHPFDAFVVKKERSCAVLTWPLSRWLTYNFKYYSSFYDSDGRVTRHCIAWQTTFLLPLRRCFVFIWISSVKVHILTVVVPILCLSITLNHHCSHSKFSSHSYPYEHQSSVPPDTVGLDWRDVQRNRKANSRYQLGRHRHKAALRGPRLQLEQAVSLCTRRSWWWWWLRDAIHRGRGCPS